MQMKDMIIALIPPLVLALIIVMIAACQPATATMCQKARACNDINSMAVLPNTDTPDIVQVLAVGLFVGLTWADHVKQRNHLKDHTPGSNPSSVSNIARERTNRTTKLLPDHRVTITIIDYPLPQW